jgi:hypothetical protein
LIVATLLTSDAMTKIYPDDHADGIERTFPKLRETTTSARVLDMLAKTQ